VAIDTVQRQCTRKGLNALAAELHDALDGFPASELLGLSLEPTEAAAGQGGCMGQMVDKTLCAWIAGLDKAIESHPQGTPEALTQMRHKLIRSRDALVALHRQFEQL
jgi:hypothetical protein